MNENSKKTLSLIFGSFVEGCSYTALKTLFVLPENATVFKKLGRFFVCQYGSAKVASSAYTKAKDIIDRSSEFIKKIEELNNEEGDEE